MKDVILLNFEFNLMKISLPL